LKKSSIRKLLIHTIVTNVVRTVVTLFDIIVTLVDPRYHSASQQDAGSISLSAFSFASVR
jgi:hypothetical protein